MSREAKGFRRVLLWSYERGTLQYDIICALILAFVFLVPRSCFVTKKTGRPEGSDPNAQYSLPVNPDSELPVGATRKVEKRAQ